MITIYWNQRGSTSDIVTDDQLTASQFGGAVVDVPSSISVQLSLAPMMVLSVGIEHPHDVPVQRLHHADPGEHGRAAVLDHQHQRLDRGLPLRRTPTLKFVPDKAHVQYWLYPP
jgi:hypothetical protein